MARALTSSRSISATRCATVFQPINAPGDFRRCLHHEFHFRGPSDVASDSALVVFGQSHYAATMIQLKSMLNCIDNSGAAIVECVAVMRKKVQAAGIGDRIIVVVQKQRSFGVETAGGSSLGITNKVRRGDIRHAVVVRARKEQRRKDGSFIKFDDNACVLINKSGDPIGSRLTSVVGAELRDKQWSKILSLAPMHV